MTANARLILAVVICLGLAALALPKLNIGYDLGAFLPAPSNHAEEILTTRLGQGPGAQLIFLKLSDSSPAAATTLADTLRRLPGIVRVLPQQHTLDFEEIPPALWQNRLLLGDLPSDVEAWAATLDQRMDDLAFAADDSGMALIAGDPALLSIDTLSAFTAGVSQPRFDQGETQYLIIETAAAAYDIAGQTQVVSAIRNVLATSPANSLLGSPVYGVDLQSSVQFEATAFSLLASVILLALVIYRFRSPYRVISVALPLVAGGLAGLLALTAIFPQVHGITLAFGFTLLGVAIDYPLHLLTHSASSLSKNTNPGGEVSIWPTLRIGIFSTLIAYSAFIFSGTVGLQQLGVFAVFAVCVAALMAGWLCPQTQTTLSKDMDVQINRDIDKAEPPTQHQRQQLRYLPSLSLLFVSAVLLYNTDVFNDNLASLTPVDADLLVADAQVREQLGVTDIRHMVAVHGTTVEEALQATEDAERVLTELSDQGHLRGVQAISQILPSQATQLKRRQQLQQPQVQSQFSEALATSAFREDAFTPFLMAWQVTAADHHYLTLDMLQADPLLSRSADTLMYADGEGWVSLLFLQGLKDPEAVQTAIATLDKTLWVDLKATSEGLVAAYRSKLLGVLSTALIAILILLVLTVGLQKLIWLLCTVAAAVLSAAAASSLWQAGLSLFDLMALTLVAGLGLDYALFYGRDRNQTEDQVTASAVLLCALSSLIVFGVLSFSSVPVLAGIGTTVALGVLAAYTLARFGRYANSGH